MDENFVQKETDLKNIYMQIIYRKTEMHNVVAKFKLNERKLMKPLEISVLLEISELL